MKEKLFDKLCEAMTQLGFERITIGDSLVFRSDNKYVRIECGEAHATVELANGLHDAENGIYDDIDLYEYDYMRKNGFPEDDDIFAEIRADIIKYIINQ